jgi:hypothetical protein
MVLTLQFGEKGQEKSLHTLSAGTVSHSPDVLGESKNVESMDLEGQLYITVKRTSEVI